MKSQIKSGKFQNNAYTLRICSSRSLVPHQSSPVNSKKSGSPTYGRLWLSDRFSLHRSHVIGNDVRIISVLYSSTKHSCDLSLIGILGKTELIHFFQYIGNITGVAYKGIISPIIHIFECTVPGKKNHIKNG